MKKVVTRIAPSPTGDMHIGTARTALFNYLYAKRMGGQFLLRIEDTDRERSTPEAEQVILDGLKWLGLEYDGAPVYQSTREGRHREVIEAMLANGSAYRCYMSVEDAAAQKAANKGVAFRSPWRDKPVGHTEDGEFVVRLKIPNGITVVNDLVKGDMPFANENLDDLVLARSDGTPVYNLAVVVDDHDMGITHVIRGDDHVNNTPRQMLIYRAMGWDLPAFGHIPLIFGEDGKKLSKRHGAASVLDFEKAGYLPEAMRNYLARLGWGAGGESEIFSDAEAEAKFDIRDVVSSPARWDNKKLNFVNHHYIGLAKNYHLAALVVDQIDGLADDEVFLSLFNDKIAALKDGADTVVKLADILKPLWKPVAGDVKAEAILRDPKNLDNLRWVYGHLLADERFPGWWTPDHVNMFIRTKADEEGYRMKDIGPVLRAALTGLATAPDLGTCLFVIGEAESLRRIKKALK